MGFFDRKPADQQPETPPGADKTSAAGGVLPQLAAAREKLKTKDTAGAMAIYESVLVGAGDRADVLVTISGDLGSTGHVKELIELLAPRYDAQRHGAAAGINLLQAYLVTRNAEAAQHLLDLLFELNRPELEARLVGFSNAVAELFASEGEAAEQQPRIDAEAKISLVSLSKPVWFYGLEALAPHLLPGKEGRPRRVAFAQCAVLGLEDAATRAAQPEEALGRLSRGLPLWFAETFASSAGYETFAAIGVSDRKHYALFPMEWVAENIRQVHDTTEGGLDYVVTGALRNRHEDFELSLRIWEVKKYRELKAFTTRWTPANADAELKKFHELVRGYMEWRALPAGTGLAYAAPAAPLAYVHGLGSALTLFLGEKGVLAPEQMPAGTDALLQSARANPDDARAQLALVAALLRLKTQKVAPDPAAQQHASAWLASPAAQAADVAALIMKLA
ncbi:MAG TPA: hypothetical protein PLQ52_05275 [Lacunisphaera sp.]|jgi:hypothetical protein|nr:hypothetical protein [Lacunisphaera sp.]HQY05453.1 hypothetical protein [Lacunisphaera sp.]